MNKYKENLVNTSSQLDSFLEDKDKIKNEIIQITEYNNFEITRDLLKKISIINNSPKYKEEVKKYINLTKESLLLYFGYLKILDIFKKEKVEEDPKRLEELLNELNNLVGLKDVKSKVNDLITYQKVQKLREKHKLHITKSTLHLAFTGNPGTGKTTVARIVGRIYKQIGLLSKGHFIEVSRTDLIAGYQGQTALKVKKVIESAKGGVLFIDEAYSITENDNNDSYGKECLTELTKALEDYREDLVVIVAGYTEPMNKFFESNPGLKSRFNTFIEFQDYNVEELEEILVAMCKNNDYLLDEKLKIKVKNFFVEQLTNKNQNFANGRMVRNVYDDLIMCQARRIINIENITREDLLLITEEDFLL